MTTPPISSRAAQEAAASQSSAPGASAPAFPARRFVPIVGMISVILLAVNGFVCATANHFFGLRGWLVWQAIPGAVALAFVAVTIAQFKYANAVLRLIYTVSAVWIGALNFAFFGAVACWIFSWADAAAGWPVRRFDLGLLSFGAALAVTIYGLINARWIRVTRVEVRLAHLPEAWRGRTIALVTDLHLGRLSGPGFLERIIARLRALEPEAVLISGDLFDGTMVKLDALVAPWRTYSAPRGIFYVTGNHDEFAERTMYLDAATGAGVRVLNNEKVMVDGLQLVGVHDGEAGDAGELRAILRGARLDRSQASILLAHQPANLAVVEEEGISLQLSGHTHGGQLWPWTLLVSRIYGKFAYGLNRLNTLQVYTSSGVGGWGPPLRVGTKSEIVLIRLG